MKDNKQLRVSFLGGYKKADVHNCIQEIKDKTEQDYVEKESELLTMKRQYSELQKSYEILLAQAGSMQEQLDSLARQKELLIQIELDAQHRAQSLMSTTQAEAEACLFAAKAEGETCLSTAQAEAEQCLFTARTEADLLLSSAQAEAEQLVAQARQEADVLMATSQASCEAHLAQYKADYLAYQAQARTGVSTTRELQQQVESLVLKLMQNNNQMKHCIHDMSKQLEVSAEESLSHIQEQIQAQLSPEVSACTSEPSFMGTQPTESVLESHEADHLLPQDEAASPFQIFEHAPRPTSTSALPSDDFIPFETDVSPVVVIEEAPSPVVVLEEQPSPLRRDDEILLL